MFDLISWVTVRCGGSFDLQNWRTDIGVRIVLIGLLLGLIQQIQTWFNSAKLKTIQLGSTLQIELIQPNPSQYGPIIQDLMLKVMIISSTLLELETSSSLCGRTRSHSLPCLEHHSAHMSEARAQTIILKHLLFFFFFFQNLIKMELKQGKNFAKFFKHTRLGSTIVHFMSWLQHE